MSVEVATAIGFGERRAALANRRVVIGNVAEVHGQQHHAGEQ